jgi:NADH-quinone oxidoreductase subunit A
MLTEYGTIYFFFLLGLFVTILLFFINYFFIPREIYFEKASTYECGFNPFEDTRGVFDIHYYLTAILFIVFDLEFIYLFPWFTISLPDYFRSYVYFFCLVLLLLGLIYELQTGVLQWTKSDDPRL